MGSHAFVRSKRTGRFYDSEKPWGVADWKDLPATNFGVGCGCADCIVPAQPFKTAGFFRRGWMPMARRYDVDYYKLHQQIKEVIKAHT